MSLTFKDIQLDDWVYDALDNKPICLINIEKYLEHIGMYSGFQLTPRLLKKLGFERKDNVFLTTYDRHIIVFDIKVKVAYIQNYDGFISEEISCQYLHEMQHIFNLLKIPVLLNESDLK